MLSRSIYLGRVFVALLLGASLWVGVITHAQERSPDDGATTNLVFLPVVAQAGTAGAQVEQAELEEEQWEDVAWEAAEWGEEEWREIGEEGSITDGTEPSADRAATAQPAGGNVTIRVSKGNLLIKGDNRSNCIVIVPGSGLTQGTVNPCDDTTINKQTDSFYYDDVDKDYKIQMQGGADRVLIDGMADDPGDIPRDLKIHTGAGDDKVTLLEVYVFGETEISMGSGIDTLEIDQQSFNSVFDDDFVVKTGSGNDAVDMCSGLALVGTKSTFNDDVKVKLGSGQDRLCICGIFAHEEVEFDGGSGSKDGYVVEETDFLEDVQPKGFELFPDDCAYLGGQDCNPPPPAAS